MKRNGLYGLAGVGTLVFLGALWRVAHQGDAPGHGLPFFISTVVFIFVLAAISLHWMHETAAVLLGAVIVWLVHYVGNTYSPSFGLIGFDESMAFVDWNVIFLLLGMMIFMAMFSETGIFGWLAYHAFRLARGNVWILGIALVSLTAVVSAFLNNVTAILLIVPLSIEIAQTVGVHPFAYVIPEVLASNIGGAATIIGDPPSTIVGSHVGLSFVEYAVNMAPIAILCMAPLLLIIRWVFRNEWAHTRGQLSPALVQQLEADARITDAALLRKAGLVGAVTFALFLTADVFGMPPSVVALTGAAGLVAWVRPDMHRMLREVDWTTLVFFIGIFVLVGALEETLVIARIAGAINDLAGDNLTLATLLMVWVPGVASGIVDNIPFTVAALPIADQLNATVPGVENLVLYWALILGADFGGNATYLGSAPNFVAVGLLAAAGYRLSFGRFMRIGIPVTIATLLLATAWLLIRY